MPMSDEELRELAEGATRVGFVGPLEEVDASDRCSLCGLDPSDPTLHGPTCPTVTRNLCGVIDAGRICLTPDHIEEWKGDWKAWRAAHEWVDLDAAPAALSAPTHTEDEGAGR